VRAILFLPGTNPKQPPPYSGIIVVGVWPLLQALSSYLIPLLYFSALPFLYLALLVVNPVKRLQVSSSHTTSNKFLKTSSIAIQKSTTLATSEDYVE